MSNPSGPAQKNLSEEDSSGSDAGSEVSCGPVAAETDRFGFIVTNGSTAGSAGPPPELVRQREAKWISIINQWDRVLMKKSSKVKVQCQKGIPASLRAKCWPLLCGATNRTKHNENLYRSLDSQPALQSWVDVIERDLDRQFPFHEMFLSRDGHGQRGLFRVLKAYTQYQPDEGYCQAQGPVAAVLLMNMPAEEAFWCLVQISEQYLPGYYSPLLEGVLFDAAMLTWVLKRTCPAAHKHLQRHGVEPLMFATDWLMCLFTRHLPFNTLLRVWDLFFCYGVRVLFQVVVVLVRLVLGRSEQRQECQGQMETLERLRSVREQVQQEDDAFIAEVCSIPLSGKDLEKQTEKELQKWRKDRPSSTFDPRGRCHGYRMVWARAQEKEEEQDRREREKGNLSVPLVRSASTLSLSPSVLRKKWRKGGKVTAGEWEGGGKVVRNLSMGANEAGWERWADLNLKKVQCVEEEDDKVSEEHKEQDESKSTGQIEQTEVLEEPKELAEKHSESTQHLEEREKVKVQEQTEQAEPEKAEKEESQGLTEVPSQQADNSLEEDRTAETEPIQGPVTAQFTENVCEHTEDASHNKQGEELECNSQSEILEQQSHNRNDQEPANRDSEEETVKPVAESEHVVATEEKETEIKRDADTDTNTDTEKQATADISEEPIAQADVKPEEVTEIENVQQETMDTVTEIRMESELQISTEAGLNSQADRDVEELSVINSDPATEMKTQQEQGEIKVTDKGSQADASEVGDQSTDLSAEMEMKAQCHTQTEVNVPAEKQEKVELTTSTQREPETDAQTGTETSVPVETQEKVELVKGTLKEPETEAQTQTEPGVPVETQEVEFATETLQDLETDTQTGTETSLAAETQEKAVLATGTPEEPETQTEEEKATDLPKDGLSPKETNAEVENGSSTECVFQNKQTDLVAPTAMESVPNLTMCPETDSEIPAVDSTPQTDEALTESEKEETETVALQPTEAEKEIVVDTHTEVEEDKDTNICDQTRDEETPTETQTHMETTDCITAPEETQASTLPANLSSTIEPDRKTSSLETVIPEEPKSQLTISPVAEEERTDNVEVEEAEVCIASPNQSVLSNVPQPGQKDACCTKDSPKDQNDSHPQMDQTDLSNPGLTQAAAGHRISTSSSDFRVRKSSSSRGHRLARRLSEDLFTAPQQAAQTQSIPAVPDSQNKHAESQSNPGTDTTQSGASSHQINEDVTLSESKEVTGSTEGTVAVETEAKQEQRPPADPPKRFGLFRRLRGEQPKQSKEKGAPKMQVPKILIQDFSDGVGKESPIEEEGEEKLSSRERRRRRRERERREKEEAKLRKKREKEMEKEKERERKKPQTRGKSFQVQRERGGADVPRPANSGSQTLRYSASYAESYF